MNGSTDDLSGATPAPSRLDVARRVEHSIALARELRSRLKRGAWERARRRARRQLRKMAGALEDAQRRVLAGEFDAALGPLVSTLNGLDVLARENLYNAPDKAGLKALRADLRAHRAALAQPAVEAEPPVASPE